MSGNSPENAALHSKKPKASAFRQQKLPAWQPILTAGTVMPTFFVIGVAFIPIGIGMLWFSDNVQELVIEYTDCKDVVDPDLFCHEAIANNSDYNCNCKLDFHIDDGWDKDVFVYYGLTNFYQNHRRYVKSRDDKQLLGEIDEAPSSNCIPFNEKDGKPIVPCGAIANSLFSDSISLKYQHMTNTSTQLIEVPLLRTGIAWESDKQFKFRNPPTNNKTLAQVFANTSKPPQWHLALWELDPQNPDNNGLQNEDLIVWMRTAALPNFRKLYRRIDHEKDLFKDGLPSGNYTLEVAYRYRVKQFSGTKSVILSQTSLLGGKNPFLGVAYIVVGSICLILGVVFLFVHVRYGKQTNDLMNIPSRTPFQ